MVVRAKIKVYDAYNSDLDTWEMRTLFFPIEKHFALIKFQQRGFADMKSLQNILYYKQVLSFQPFH